MNLSGKTKLNELFDRYPFLVEFLGSYKPRYSGLLNPALRESFGGSASLKQLALQGEVELPVLLAAVRDTIQHHSGEEVGIELSPELSPAQQQDVLKGLILDLHAGHDPEEIKRRFAELIEAVSPGEIAALEQALVAEGMPEEEIRRMCDVHVQIMQPALGVPQAQQTLPGHPVHTFMAENRAFEQRAKQLQNLIESLGAPPDEVHYVLVSNELKTLVQELAGIELHYQRKEHQLFPFLEQHGVTAPPKVMWGIHDEIRAMLKEIQRALRMTDLPALAVVGSKLAQAVLEMIIKEERVLFPMALELLSDTEWRQVRSGEQELGYALVTPGTDWPALDAGQAAQAASYSGGLLAVQTGALTLAQINLIITHLPFEMSFVDENDEVRFYSNTPERLFPRSPAVIGRKVHNCHPASSLHMVQRIIEAFRAGEKDVAEFWINYKESYVHIRYFAVRDASGIYRGTLEVVQDVGGIQLLSGEQRLLDWDAVAHAR